MQIVKENDFVEIEYDAYIKENNALFDTTDEDLAKRKGVYWPDEKYGSIIIPIRPQRSFLRPKHASICIFGPLPLEGKEVGKEYTLEMPSSKCFGSKESNLIRVVPLRLLKNASFQISSYVNVLGSKGIIIGRNGIRITVDFNHPLAGKSLVYVVRINRIVNDLQEKLKVVEELLVPSKTTLLLENQTLIILTARDILNDEIFMDNMHEIKLLIPEIKSVIQRL